MAALSSAESPPSVFNGDTMNRDPERDPGLDELGAGLEPACPGGAAIPDCQQDIPEEVQWGSRGWRSARVLSGAGLDGDVQETPVVIRIVWGCNALQGARWCKNIHIYVVEQILYRALVHFRKVHFRMTPFIILSLQFSEPMFIRRPVRVSLALFPPYPAA